MQLFKQTPSNEREALSDLYARFPIEGMVQSSLMCGERFERADDFDESLGSPAITWSSGGEETYDLDDGKQIHVKSAGALCLSAQTRYDYAASNDQPFLSNMIVFPRWIVAGANESPVGSHQYTNRMLKTQLYRPDQPTEGLMNMIANRCRAANGSASGSASPALNDWFGEHCAILYGALLDAQDTKAAATSALDAVKASTRANLAARTELAQEFILQEYANPGLSLTTIARHACLSPYHLIRVFKALNGATPMQFLANTRTDAGMRLLQNTKLNIGEISARVGFSDRTAFFKSFRNRFGKAPSTVARPA